FQLFPGAETGWDGAVLVEFPEIKIIRRVISHRVSARLSFGCDGKPYSVYTGCSPVFHFFGEGVPPFEPRFHIPVKCLHHYPSAIVVMVKVGFFRNGFRWDYGIIIIVIATSREERKD